jgi:hypothetical protein
MDQVQKLIKPLYNDLGTTQREIVRTIFDSTQQCISISDIDVYCGKTTVIAVLACYYHQQFRSVAIAVKSYSEELKMRDLITRIMKGMYYNKGLISIASPKTMNSWRGIGPDAILVDDANEISLEMMNRVIEPISSYCSLVVYISSNRGSDDKSVSLLTRLLKEFTVSTNLDMSQS